VLAAAHARVVEVPQLGPLAARVPLAEVVAQREHALLRARALLVAAGAAEARVEPCSAIASSSVTVCSRLREARGPVSSCTRPAVDRRLHARHEQRQAGLGDEPVAELDHLGEVVARVDVQQRERDAARRERLLGQPQQHDRVLAAGEQQRRPLALGGDLAHDVDRLGLEVVEMAQTCRPHSVFSLPAQRPSRPVPGCVQCVQPIEANPPSCSGWYGSS
jgi:hypothetical protein